jgi:acetyl-CoA carboxylase carboxyl transferase subunit alpha
VDEVIEEPLGGAHRNHQLIAERLKSGIIRHLSSLEKLSPEELLEQRLKKIASFGVFSEAKE